MTNHIVPEISTPLEPWAMPIIHHGRLLPARKYDSGLLAANFATNQPTAIIRRK